MNLLERYLAALKRVLPLRTQADVLREIEDEIQSQMEEKADALGRPLTEQEEAEIIRKYGHPIVVASRYGQARYLIGPEIFPFYGRTLKLSLIVATAIWSVVIAVALASSTDPAHEWMPQVLRIPGALITVFGTTTALFAAAELSRGYLRLKVPPSWDPLSLPRVARSSAKRTQSISEICGGLISLVWWQLLPSMPVLAFGPAALFLALGPAWKLLHWPVLILIAANVGKSAIQLVWPEHTTFYVRFAILLGAAELLVLLIATQAGEWVTVNPAIGSPGHLAATTDVLNRIVNIGCVVSLFIRTIQFALKSVRHWRESGDKSGWRAVSAL